MVRTFSTRQKYFRFDPGDSRELTGILGQKSGPHDGWAFRKHLPAMGRWIAGIWARGGRKREACVIF